MMHSCGLQLRLVLRSLVCLLVQQPKLGQEVAWQGEGRHLVSFSITWYRLVSLPISRGLTWPCTRSCGCIQLPSPHSLQISLPVAVSACVADERGPTHICEWPVASVVSCTERR